jgi:hypothetical protein
MAQLPPGFEDCYDQCAELWLDLTRELGMVTASMPK